MQVRLWPLAWGTERCACAFDHNVCKVRRSGRQFLRSGVSSFGTHEGSFGTDVVLAACISIPPGRIVIRSVRVEFRRCVVGSLQDIESSSGVRSSSRRARVLWLRYVVECFPHASRSCGTGTSSRGARGTGRKCAFVAPARREFERNAVQFEPPVVVVADVRARCCCWDSRSCSTASVLAVRISGAGAHLGRRRARLRSSGRSRVSPDQPRVPPVDACVPAE